MFQKNSKYTLWKLFVSISRPRSYRGIHLWHVQIDQWSQKIDDDLTISTLWESIGDASKHTHLQVELVLPSSRSTSFVSFGSGEVFAAYNLASSNSASLCCSFLDRALLSHAVSPPPIFSVPVFFWTSTKTEFHKIDFIAQKRSDLITPFTD